MSTFVIVPGAWDRPATLEPLVERLESAGHAVTIVDLPCDVAEATLEQYADAVRAVLPGDLADSNKSPRRTAPERRFDPGT